MRARASLLAAAMIAAPACAGIFGIEELPEGSGGHAGSSAGPSSGAAGGSAQSPCGCPATQDWTRVFATTGDVTVAGVAVNDNGIVILAGSVTGDLEIDGLTLPGGADHDVFVAALGACGERLWARRFGDGAEQRALGLAIEPSGSPHANAILLTGAFIGKLAFGGAAPSLQAGTQRAFVARLDPKSGDGLAAASAGSGPAQGTTIAATANGSAYWAGTEQAGSNLFVRRLDPDLAVANAITPACAQCDPRLARVPGGAAIAGGFLGSFDLVAGGAPPLTASGTDVYVASLVPHASSFNEQKAKSFGDGAAQMAAGIAANASGDLYVAGRFEGTLSMGGSGKTKSSTGAGDAFVAKLDASLSPQWLASFGGSATSDQRATAVAVKDRIAVVGDFTEALDAGAIAQLTSAGGADAFLLILDPAGAVLHATSFGSAGADHAAGVAFDASGAAIVAGVLDGPLTLGCGTLGDKRSIFVARRSVP